MGAIVLILGDSGSGKSTSLRNFEPGEVAIFNVAAKPLPFRKHLPKADRAGYPTIKAHLSKNEFHAYVVDDSTYLMAFDNFSRAKENGYAKFVEMALSFQQLLTAAAATDDDTIVYFMHHPEHDAEGRVKPKTIGKMLDEKLCVEGLFPIVLSCEVHDGKHVFVTENDGYNLVKAPMGMFDAAEIDNDLKAVDTIIREYWEMAPLGKEPHKTKKEGANA